LKDKVKLIQIILDQEKRLKGIEHAIIRKLEARLDHLETWMEIPEKFKLKDSDN
jgi:hypothetical protein